MMDTSINRFLFFFEAVFLSYYRKAPFRQVVKVWAYSVHQRSHLASLTSRVWMTICLASLLSKCYTRYASCSTGEMGRTQSLLYTKGLLTHGKRCCRKLFEKRFKIIKKKIIFQDRVKSKSFLKESAKIKIKSMPFQKRIYWHFKQIMTTFIYDYLNMWICLHANKLSKF